MSYRTELIDEIVSPTTATIKIGTKETYVNPIVVADLENEDIPSWAAVLSVTSGGTDPVPITAGVTDTPLVVAYTGYENTSYTLRRVSDNSFDWNTNVEYDGSNFTIRGTDDGTGKFADSYTFAIKP